MGYSLDGKRVAVDGNVSLHDLSLGSHFITVHCYDSVSGTYVFTFPIFLTTPTVIPPDQIEYQNAIQKKHKKMLDQSFRMVKKLKPSLMIEKRQCTGRPADEIVRISSEENFDLIIMGSRGLGGIKQFFLGSVSDRVADEAKCPVLLVKKMEDR